MITPYQNITDSFPELKDVFHELKVNDHHFQHVLNQYQELDNLAHQVDQGHKVLADLELEKIKKERLAFKDTIYQLMLQHKNQSSN